MAQKAKMSISIKPEYRDLIESETEVMRLNKSEVVEAALSFYFGNKDKIDTKHKEFKSYKVMVEDGLSITRDGKNITEIHSLTDVFKFLNTLL